MTTRLTFQPRFGRHLLLKRIAVGGMAEIYRALAFGTEGFKKLVAIKRILPHLSKDNEYKAMFTEEAKLVASLNHPNIVRLYDFGCIDDMLYHSMEYVHGQNLGEIIRTMQFNKQAVPIEPICHIFSEVLSGLEQAHRNCDHAGKPLNIVHRDMSPSNIIVSYEGEVKIADFGIAKTGESNIQTQYGTVKGKFKYMSPEQASGKKLDQRTDIFSLGICFYEMLTLTELFHDVNQFEVMKKVRKAKVKNPRALDPNIPVELEKMVLKALKKKPKDRFSSATEWREALSDFMVHNDLNPSDSKQLAGFMHRTFYETMNLEKRQIASEIEQAERLHMDSSSPSPKVPSARKGTFSVSEEVNENWPTNLDEDPFSDREDTDETTAPRPNPDGSKNIKVEERPTLPFYPKFDRNSRTEKRLDPTPPGDSDDFKDVKTTLEENPSRPGLDNSQEPTIDTSQKGLSEKPEPYESERPTLTDDKPSPARKKKDKLPFDSAKPVSDRERTTVEAMPAFKSNPDATMVDDPEDREKTESGGD